MRKMIFFAAVMAAMSVRADYSVTQWRASSPIKVAAPFMNDSVNSSGEKFALTSLLDNPVRAKVNGAIVEADTAGVVTLSPEKGTLQLLQTQLRSARFAKPTLKVTSQVPFKVYVDGNEVASKLTAQKDSIDGSSTATASLRLEPKHDVTLTIKALNMAEDSIAAPTIQVTVEGDGEYASGADMQRRFALDDTQYGNRVSGLSMSPDGKYLITNYYNYYNAQRWRVWSTLTDLKTGKEINSSLPGNVKWMPKGSRLYYTTAAADGFDLFLVDPQTGAQTLYAEAIPTDNFTWSPNEDYFIYTLVDNGTQEQGPLRRYRTPDDRMPGNRTTYMLRQFDPKTGMTRTLTFGNHTTSLMDISADGNRLLVMSSGQNPQVRPFYEQTIYELDLQTMKADTLVARQPSFINGGIYSPNGKEILFWGSPSAFNELGKNCGNHPIANDFDIQAYVMTIDTKAVKALSRDFDPSIQQILSWNHADNLVYMIAEEGFGRTLWSLNPRSGEFKRLPQEVAVVNGATMGDLSDARLAYFGQGYEYAGKAYILDLKKGRNTLLADPRADDLAQVNLGKVEPWKFTAKDGTVIDGMMCLPPDFDPNKKYPLIVYYYGGTSPTQSTITQPYTPQLFASRDYVVYVINPSGTTGYGQEFSARHVNAWGKQTADDIIEGVQKFCEAHPFVDSEKIGCLGASYGGFMTQYLQTLTPMFAAAVSHAGISNVTSYWGEGYWGYSYNSVAAADSYPWSNPELFTKQGSLFNADKINTPLLLLHGTADTNVPIGESIQLFNALKILGKDVEFISVDGENHFIADYPKRILWQNSIMAWFEKWLKGDSSWWDDLYKK
ncbi:MAG: prolyl oligopeptidase family serine peptidase [Muribaculaceae bacterium]|nr:prolyl oligopeptidase family serine peptidase [Muribaculaceae bacterium]